MNREFFRRLRAIIFFELTAYFVLHGKPKTYKPPRFQRGGNVYAGHNTTMKAAKEVLADQMALPALRDVPLLAYIELYFKRPQSHYKKGQLREDAPKYVMKTPDVDNCTKFVLDALQPRVIHDDKFVSKIVVEKLWCETDTAQRTMIELHVRV